jgi:two-component system, sensor histidine kinase and response regulator
MDKKKILVVEDEKDIREDIISILEMSNYTAFGAENGGIALQLIQNKLPDLIISDIMMPVLNGYGLLSELQKLPNASTIPFLFLTAKSDKVDIREGMSVGADDYITKPFDIDQLLKSVEMRLKKHDIEEKKYIQKIEDLRSSIRSSIPHEIRTPLNAILGFSDILIKTIDHSSQEEILDMLTNINVSAKRLFKIFEKYILYTNLEITATNSDEIKQLCSNITYSAKSTIEEVSRLVIDKCFRKHDLKLKITDIPLFIAEDYLAKIVEELTENCCKFSESGSPILIEGHSYDSRFTLTFTDFGRGMTTEQVLSTAPYIQFDRKKYEQQGAGLGLAIVKRIVEIHNGEFFIESIPAEYTKVKIKLPVATY